MKRHLVASAVGVGAGNEEATGGPLGGTQAPLAWGGLARTRAASNKPNLALATPRLWTHTVVLTGDLNRHSAHTLEAEIERLCEDGVTGITLDLRELTRIDSIGVAVIAFRCDLCTRRGYDFALIRGSRMVQRAFERAGLGDRLPFREVEVEEQITAQAQ
jgi:anti-anti-sigma factor